MVGIWIQSRRRLAALLLSTTPALVVAACAGTAGTLESPLASTTAPPGDTADASVTPHTSSSGAEALSEESGGSDGSGSSGGSEPVDLPEPASSEGTKPTACPKLESALYQLTQSNDPATDAAKMGLQYEAGNVRVIVELNQPESGQLATYQATIERQLEQTVRVLVPLQNVCALSDDDAVDFVRAPSAPSAASRLPMSGAVALSETDDSSDDSGPSGGSEPVDLSEPASSEGTKPTACPKLESALYQLTQSNDPATDAAKMGLQYEAGNVRVIADLNQPESGQLAAYQATIERQLEQTVRVLVPLQNVCALSDDAAVDFVRARSAAAAQ